ncbi:MAG: hypothetical protein ACFB0D_06990 [Phormidesmis sp.]
MMIPKPSEAIHSVVDWYRATLAAGDIPFWIVFAIAIYTPFEEFLIKWMPSAIGSLIRFFPEVVLYGLMIQVLGTRFFKTRNLKATPIDLLLMLFFLSTLISMLINGSRLAPSLINMRALCRYLSVFYIVVNINISNGQLKAIVNGIKIAGLVEAGIASVQYFLPDGIVAKIFAPRELKIGGFERVSQAESGEIKIGSVFGTFASPAVLSAFLLLTLVICLVGFFMTPDIFAAKLRALPSMGMILFGLFASKKRASWLIAILLPLVVLYFRRRSKGLAKTIWLYVLLLLILLGVTSFLGSSFDTSFAGVEARERSIDVGSYILQLFSPSYWQRSSENARGWVVITIVSTLFKSGSWFGFGPDIENVRNIIYDMLVDGSDRYKILELDPLEDTYWFALMAYFGVIGLGLYIAMIWRLFRAGRWLSKFSPNPEYRRLGTMFCTIVVVTVLYAFVERIFKFRAFSFYFWMFSGLVVNAYNNRERKETPPPRESMPISSALNS